jgi:bacterioferritin-associated ferredoxin
MYVCICHAVTEAEIVAEISAGAQCEADVHERTRAGTGCGSCVDRISDLLDENLPAHCPRRVLAGLQRTA